MSTILRVIDNEEIREHFPVVFNTNGPAIHSVPEGRSLPVNQKFSYLRGGSDDDSLHTLKKDLLKYTRHEISFTCDIPIIPVLSIQMTDVAGNDARPVILVQKERTRLSETLRQPVLDDQILKHAGFVGVYQP